MDALHILVVDDEATILKLVSTLLTRNGHECVAASSGAEALALIREQDFDIMLSDISMAPMDGLELVRQVKLMRPQTVCVLMSGAGTRLNLIAAMKLGVFDFLDKPFHDLSLLTMVVERAAASRRLVQERDTLLADLQRQNSRLEASLTRLHAAYGQLRQQEAMLESDLRQAQRVQRKLLPAGFPSLAGVDLFGYFGPCERLGGDFFGTVPLGSDRLALYLVDVAGHGVSAAMITIILRELMQPRRHLHNRVDVFAEPARALTFLNQALVDEAFDPPILVTMVYAVIDVHTGLVTVASAGHPSPILVQGAEQTRLLPAEGPVLGLQGTEHYQAVDFTLHPGDVLLFYSDGVTEARQPDGGEYGQAELRRLLGPLHGQSAPRIARALEESLRGHLGGQSPADDMTFLVVSRMLGVETAARHTGHSAAPLMAGSVRVVLPPRITAPSAGPGDCLQAGWSGATVVVRCTGLTTWKVAPTVRELMAKAEAEGTGPVRFEMAGCQSLDSTMLGLLYQFARQLVLHRPTERVCGQLREMGIERCFAFSDGPAPEIDVPITTAAAANEAVYADMILDAHQSLMETSEENRQRFEGVVAAFRAKLHGDGEKPPAPVDEAKPVALV